MIHTHYIQSVLVRLCIGSNLLCGPLSLQVSNQPRPNTYPCSNTLHCMHVISLSNISIITNFKQITNLNKILRETIFCAWRLVICCSFTNVRSLPVSLQSSANALFFFFKEMWTLQLPEILKLHVCPGKW